MKVSAMNNPGNKPLEELNKLTKLGFRSIELAVEGPEVKSDQIDTQKIKEFRNEKEKEKKPIKFIAHAPWELNLGSPYESVRKGAVEEAKNVIRTLDELDIDFLTIHAFAMVSGSYKKKAKEKLLSKFIKSAKEVTEFAQERDIIIGIENTQFVIKLKDFEKIFKGVPEAEMTLDIGHAYIELDNEEEIIEFIEENIEKIGHIHIHDNFGQEDDHLPLGVGEIDWEKIIGALKEVGYDKYITAEIHSHDREYLYISKRKIEREWRDQ